MERSKAWSYFWFGLFGALLGAALVTWLAPGIIAWYFKPPAAMGFSCEKPIEWALQRLRLIQLCSLAGGAGVGVFIRFAFRRHRPAQPPVGITILK